MLNYKTKTIVKFESNDFEFSNPYEAFNFVATLKTSCEKDLSTNIKIFTEVYDVCESKDLDEIDVESLEIILKETE